MHTGLLWNFVISILTIFLMGPALGSLLTLISILLAAILYWMDYHGYSFPRHSTIANSNTVIFIFSAFLTIITACVTWLYDISRKNARHLERKKNIELKKENKKRLLVEQDLENINRSLEKRIQDATRNELEKEKLFSQQARMAAMGEMLGAIAHQWRQPLNTLALTIQDIQEAHHSGELNHDYMEKRVHQAMENINHMSQTIDDFRNFSLPSKEKLNFSVKDGILGAIKIADWLLNKHDIKLLLSGMENSEEPESDYLVYGYQNEFKQVILNIIQNAVDAIEEYRIKITNEKYAGIIKITLLNSNGLKIILEDNGGGISQNALPQLFLPYFTTKAPGKGTGIGLYMSKKIIEENFSGWLFGENIANGARFTIILCVI